MNFQQYVDISGISVPASKEAATYAQIQRTQIILETLLGYSLDPDLVDENQYEELGKLQNECPCLCNDVDVDNLDPADDVVYAYRLFPYNAADKYLFIDPCTAVHAVKLVKDGVTFRTLDPDEYRLDYKRGIIKFIEQCDRWCFCKAKCDCVQLAVDADWVFPTDADLPFDLQMVWADMVTYYSDSRRDIKRQTMGPHTYERFDREKPEMLPANLQIIERYAGPNGTVSKIRI